METLCKVKSFKTICTEIHAKGRKLWQKRFLAKVCWCLKVRLFVCASVCPFLTTPKFLERIIRYRYLQKPYAKRKALRPFEKKYMHREKNYGKKVLAKILSMLV